MGGEKISTTSWPRCWKGSPPRGRGKGGHFPGRVRPQGITPAWAGKSGAGYADKGRPGDHPRVGGEKRRLSECAQWAEGSPPRGRGKVNLGPQLGAGDRITPAWAGKRATPRKNGCPGGDHPRVGGEKWYHIILRRIRRGSPPRGRGKAHDHLVGTNKMGITPAWAGKSWKACSSPMLSLDHPRVGGEKISGRSHSPPRRGSPPRGRGKVVFTVFVDSLEGITPAWAGKRLKRSHRSGIFISGPIPFHSVLHRPAGSGGSRAGRDGSLAGQPQNAGPA